MSFELPAWLQTAIAGQASGERALADASRRVTEHYRAASPSSVAVGSAREAAAYLATRLPATFAAISAALVQSLAAEPGFRPRSMLDVGAGPGTASLAAATEIDGLEEFRLLDKNRPFLDVAAVLLKQSPNPALNAATIDMSDLNAPLPFPQADLVIMAYALIELPRADFGDLAARLWAACRGILLLVEPGTPAGYANILRLRTLLLDQGANIIAPCPGGSDCPLVAPDWCHFAARLPRSRLHKQVKRASLAFEDEKFAYLAVSRRASPHNRSRILAPPHHSKIGVTFKLCTENGLQVEKSPSRDRARFKADRKLNWGETR
jgi:ribosomal protein RSM22 (predicted rRNA methylase)